MAFFSRLFRKKEGGTLVGNLLRLTPASIALQNVRALIRQVRGWNQ